MQRIKKTLQDELSKLTSHLRTGLWFREYRGTAGTGDPRQARRAILAIVPVSKAKIVSANSRVVIYRDHTSATRIYYARRHFLNLVREAPDFAPLPARQLGCILGTRTHFAIRFDSS
jgi:hypothetical protein